MVGKSVLLVWATFICGSVVVDGKPQVFNKPSSSPSQPQQRSSPAEPSDSDSPYPVAVGNTKGFELSHGYSINAAANTDGEPYTSGWAYVGGRAGNGPTYLKDTVGYSGSDLWSAKTIDIATTGLYLTAGIVALGSLYYIGSPLLPGGTSRKPTKSSKGSNKDSSTTEKKAEKSSRRRRDVHNQADADLTRLASIVLNAIASGECLQKTICQIGTQVGESPKGRLAFSLIDTLLPPSVHTNQYFITMKKSLKGESQCQKFNCNNNY